MDNHVLQSTCVEYRLFAGNCLKYESYSANKDQASVALFHTNIFWYQWSLRYKYFIIFKFNTCHILRYWHCNNYFWNKTVRDFQSPNQRHWGIMSWVLICMVGEDMNGPNDQRKFKR